MSYQMIWNWTMPEKSPAAKRHRADRRTRRKRERKIWAIKTLGGKCVNCGETDPEELQFHHMNGETKAPGYRGISDAAQWSWERFTAEVSKCVLFCMSCHLEQHRKAGYTVLSEDKIGNLFSSEPDDDSIDDEFDELWDMIGSG